MEEKNSRSLISPTVLLILTPLLPVLVKLFELVVSVWNRGGINATFIAGLPEALIRAYRDFDMVYNYKALANLIRNIYAAFPALETENLSEIIATITIQVPHFFRTVLIFTGVLFFTRKKVVWFLACLSLFVILGLGIPNLVLSTWKTREFVLMPVITFSLLIYALRDVNQPEIREEFGLKSERHETDK